MAKRTHRSSPSILVIDGALDHRNAVSGELSALYAVNVAPSGSQGLEIAKAQRPDLILLDVVMPDMEGYEVCRRLKADPETRSIPVIFLTAINGAEDVTKGLALGAVDYLAKPVSPPILLARVATHLALKASNDFLRARNDDLEQEVARRTEEVEAVQDVTIHLMASLAETRDYETGNHLLRTQNYILALAEQVIAHPRFRAFLQAKTIRLLYKSAPLHDIGKVGIQDSILLKPGPLTHDEFEIMKTHSILGWQAINRAEAVLGRKVEFLNLAKDIARHHHEKWDGSGYPDGLAGEDIPIASRMMAIADVYDALISKRVYKGAIAGDEAMRMIADGRGQHFDPVLADAFIAIQPRIEAIARRYDDPGD